ncbi:U3 snoRNP protein, partial [Coemansia sp. RSA 1804]
LHRRLRAIRRFRSLIATSVNASTISKDPSAMDVDGGDNDGDGIAEDLSANEDEDDEDIEVDSPNPNAKKSANGKTARPTIGALNPLNFGTQGSSPISAANIRTIFMPLLENWALADSTTVVHDLADESISTIGVIGAVLPWPQYNSAIRKYFDMMKKSPTLEKRLTRLV